MSYLRHPCQGNQPIKSENRIRWTKNSTATVRFIGQKEEDAQQLSWLLSNASNAQFSFEHVACLDSFVNTGRDQQGEVIILDLTESTEDRINAVSLLGEKIPLIPVVVLTGDDEKVGRDAIPSGSPRLSH